jgi:AmmeMemoRadiSam system protein B
MAVVAGRFYEGTEDLLRKRIEDSFVGSLGPGRMPEGPAGSTRRIKALVAPHAGYMYSGMPAAHSYLRLFEDGEPEHIVIFGPNHTGMGARVAVCNDDWETPLGNVRFDTELGGAIVEHNEFATNDCIAHSREHSIEVQLPFLQYLLGPGFSFVPIAIGDQSYKVCEALGKSVAEVSKEMDTLVIASSDFSHHEPAEIARKKDDQALEYLQFMDPKGFLDFVRDHRVSICGAGPIVAAMVYAQERGATEFRILKYTTSGDVIGDNRSVVAYVAAEMI